MSPAAGAGPGVTFTVTPVGAGTAHVVVTDNHGGSQTVTVSVALAPGPLMASPNNLLFTALGPTNAQPFTASEANYSGQISVAIDHPSVATVTPPSGSGPSANFTVTPLSAGTAQITVTDDHGGSTAVTVNVAPPGALTVTPGNLTFDSASAASQTFDASETSYNRSIFTSGCAAVATVSPGTGTGPDQTFSVTPKAAGSCTLTVFDDHGGSQTVAITVFGSLNVGPTTLNFNGTTNAKNITAQETAYSGQFTTSGCSGIVTITPSTGSGPSATLAVKPVSSGSCTITVSDDHGNSSPVGVTVSAGTLSANPNALTFTSASAAGQQFTAAETNFTGAFNVSGCSGIVNVAPNPGTGPSQIFTVSPAAKGSCTLTVSDGTNTATVDVTVFGAINLTPNTLSFSGTTSPQTLTAQEDFYAGAFTLTDPTCAGIVTVTGGGNGPTQHYTVTPLAAGSCSVRVQDDHGGFDTSTVTVSTGTIGVAPGSLTFNSASAASQNVTATENDYAGPFNVSGCSGVVNVAPNPGTGPSQLFTVSPVAPGSCTLTVSDDHSGSGVVSITVFGSLQLVPGSLTFGDVGAASAQHFAIDEANFTGTFSVDASACTGIASIDAGPFTGPSASVTVTPQNSGACSISVSDSHGGSAPESVTVGPFGAIVPSSASLTFSDIGSAANQSFTVSESGYSGAFTIDASACAGVATVSPASGTSSTSFVVTPVAASGPCNLHVSDDHGSTTANVSVTVGPFGSLAPSTASLQFNDVGPTITQTFTVSESGYTGSLTLNESACAGVASVNPTSGSTSTTFTVTSVGAGGPCSLSISDDHGSPNATVSVTVGPFGPVSPSPGSVSLTVAGANGSFTVSETGYAGTFTADASSCGSAASVSPASGTTFTVSPGTTAGNCAISVSDDHGQGAKVNVFVTSGAMTVDNASLQFGTPPAPTQTFTATSPSATLITITSAPDPLVATVSPASGAGPSVTFTVTPVGNGRTSLTVSDGLGGQAVVSIGVGMTPLAKTRHPLATRKPLPKQSGNPAPGPRAKLPPLINRPSRPIGQPPSPLGSPGQPGGGSRAAYGALATGALSVVFRNGSVPQSLAVFELNYAGTISVSSSDPNVVTVANPLLRGPNAWLILVPHHAGVAVIRLADDHGSVREISVLVQAAAIRPPGVRPVNPPGHPPTNP